MYRFNPAPPEGRTATSTAPRSHSPTHLDSTYSTSNLTAPPNLLVIYRPIPLSLMNAESTSNANQTTPKLSQIDLNHQLEPPKRPQRSSPRRRTADSCPEPTLEPDGMNGMEISSVTWYTITFPYMQFNNQLFIYNNVRMNKLTWLDSFLNIKHRGKLF